MSRVCIDLVSERFGDLLETEAFDILNSGSADRLRFRQLCDQIFAEMGDSVVFGSFVRVKSGIWLKAQVSGP